MVSSKYSEYALSIEPRILDADVDLATVMDLEHDTAFISGSVVEGFGNSTSDVDIYVISDKIPNLPNGIKFGYTDTNRGYYNEVIVYHYEYVADVCNAVNNNQIDLNSYDFLEKMELYYRFAIGIPIVNEHIFHSVTVGFCKETACEAYRKYYKLKSNENLELAYSLLSDNMVEQSEFYTQWAAIYAMTSWMAQNGESYKSEKFHFRKLARICKQDSKMYKKCWQLYFMGDKNPREYFNEVTAFCKELGMSELKHCPQRLKFSLAKAVSHIQLSSNYLIVNGNTVFEINREQKAILDMLECEAASKTDLLRNINIDLPNLEATLEEMLEQGILVFRA